MCALGLFTQKLLAAEVPSEETKTKDPQTNTKLVKPTPDPKNDEADKIITNRMIRASTGSLSRFSMNTALSYSGGSLTNPFAAERPNIANAGDTTSIVGVSGSIIGSLRINPTTRLNLGAGLQMLAPFNDSIKSNDPNAQREFKENRGELDIANPFVSLSKMSNIAGIQSVATLSVSQFTAGNFTDSGYQNEVGLSWNTLYNVGTSGFSVGALMLYSKYIFNNDDPALLRRQTDVVYGILPQAEYVINDRFNLRTIVRSNWYQNTNADRDFVRRPVTQSVGLGISVSRDVFLYPNIQFAYKNLSADNTNIGFTANINMF
jgi:hypothetical protein